MNRKPLLQLMLDLNENELVIGMVDGLKEEDVEYITSLCELIGKRMLKSLSKAKQE